VC
ncbi:dehydrogenase E1 component family protein, partial [Chlamydia psittaci 06-1683]|jgi:hypothetical protein